VHLISLPIFEIGIGSWIFHLTLVGYVSVYQKLASIYWHFGVFYWIDFYLVFSFVFFICFFVGGLSYPSSLIIVGGYSILPLSFWLCFWCVLCGFQYSFHIPGKYHIFIFIRLCLHLLNLQDREIRIPR
jgi:hypothetical protein